MKQQSKFVVHAKIAGEMHYIDAIRIDGEYYSKETKELINKDIIYWVQ